MDLKEKINLLVDLSDDERKKLVDKFLPSIGLVSYEELSDAINYLKDNKVKITKAIQVKVLCEDSFTKQFSILSKLSATDLYREDPLALIQNPLDIYRHINYCIQKGIDYKDEAGHYKDIVTDEKAWREMVDRENAKTVASLVEDEPVISEPVKEETPAFMAKENDEVLDDKVFSFTEPVQEVVEEKPLNNLQNSTPNQDIQDFINNTDEMDEQIRRFSDVRKNLEDQLAALDALSEESSQEIDQSRDNSLQNNGNGNYLDDNYLAFDQIMPESYGIGRR